MADAQGLSYYSGATRAQRLRLGPVALVTARAQLIALDLIAYEAPLYQVLGLPEVQARALRLAPAARPPSPVLPCAPAPARDTSGPVTPSAGAICSASWSAVLDYETGCQIRDPLGRQQLSVTQTAQALGLGARAVTKWRDAEFRLRAAPAVRRASKIGPFKGQIVRWLTSANPASPTAPGRSCSACANSASTAGAASSKTRSRASGRARSRPSSSSTSRRASAPS